MNAPPTGQPLSLLRRLLRLGADHPASVLLLVLAISVAALVGALRVTLDAGMTRLADAEGIERQTYLHIIREFGSDRRNVIYLRDEQMWTPGRLLTVRRLHDALRQLPFVERVDSVYSSPSVVMAEGHWLAQPLLPTVPEDGVAAEAARQRVLADPFALRHLVSADGKALAIHVAIREAAADDIHAAIEALLTPQRGQFASAFQVGPARLQHALQTALRHDLAVVAPLFLLALWGMLWGFTRSAFAAALPLLVGILGLLWTAGALGYAGLPLGVLAIFLPLLATLAGVLQILRMASGAYAEVTGDAAHQHHRRQPDRRHLTAFMVRDLGLPLILTVLALALGFASTLFMQETRALRDFWLTTLLVMLSSGVLTVLLAPALVTTFAPMRARPAPFPALARLAEWLARIVGLLRRCRLLGALLMLALGGGAVFLHQATGPALANDPWSYLKEADTLLRDAARLQADMAGPQVFYVVLDSNVEGGFREPSNLRRLADIQAFIARQPAFDRSHSLVDRVMQANPSATGAPQMPATRRLVMQALMPHTPHDLEPYISHDWRRANIVVRHNLRDSSQINRHVGELRQAVANYAGPGMVTAVVGESLLANAAADRFPHMQLTALGVLLGAVFVVMTLMYTSIKGGLIALAPGLAPIALMFGGMQVLDIPLSPATLVAAIVVIGIAAESSVHLFSRYSALARTLNDSEAAVLETVRREALPMLAIHFTLAVACLAWTASELVPAVQFGMLAAVTLLLSALTNLVLTPLLMAHIRLVGLYEILALSMQREALAASPLFQGMSELQIRKTILISDLVEVAAGHCLITQGSIDRCMYVVVNGRFEVVRREGGSERRRAVVSAGDVIGEIGFVRETRRIADVRALETASALRFDYARLKKDLAYFPYLMNQLSFNISGILGQRLAELVEARSAADATDAANAVPPAPTATPAAARDT